MALQSSSSYNSTTSTLVIAKMPAQPSTATARSRTLTLTLGSPIPSTLHTRTETQVRIPVMILIRQKLTLILVFQSSKPSSFCTIVSSSLAPPAPAGPIKSTFDRPDAASYWTDLRCAFGTCEFICPSCGGSSGSRATPQSAPAQIQTLSDLVNGVDYRIRPSLNRSPTYAATTMKRTSTASSFTRFSIRATVRSLGRKMGTISRKLSREQ
jgi:hypothetical protein